MVSERGNFPAPNEEDATMVAIKNAWHGLTVYICVVGESIQPHLPKVIQATAYVAADGRWTEVDLAEIDLRAAFGCARNPIAVDVGIPGHDYPA